jgi:trehalose/maltose hydrolase-like predicted phosphorylase
MALSKVNIGRIAEDGAVKSVNIVDGTITNADVNACAAIVQSKTDTMSETQKNNAQMNVALLGFKMAVTESLTIFNLVDGVVD